jgi:hypothetical protein
MKKSYRVLREILYQVYEQGKQFLSQKAISQACEISLGSVNPLVTKLEGIGAIQKRPLGFRVIDTRKILLYWASTRDLAKDIVYRAHSPELPSQIEEEMPEDVIRTAYSGYRARFEGAPTDYGVVYVYGRPESVKRRFGEEGDPKNILVLKSDEHLERLSKDGVAPLAQIYVDLWQLPPPANRFVEELDQKLEAVGVGGLEGMIRRAQK